MEPRHPARSTDLKIIALLAVMLACLIALIALLFHDTSASASRLQPMLSAHAAVLHGAPSPAAKAAVVDSGPQKPASADEKWSADDSSQGLRPDAAH